jgi:hypothetical protein
MYWPLVTRSARKLDGVFSTNYISLLPLSLVFQTSQGYKACQRHMRQFYHWPIVKVRVYARRVQRIVGQGSAMNGIGCDAGQLRPQTCSEGSKRMSFLVARWFLLPYLAHHDPVDGEDSEIVLDTLIRKRLSRKNKTSTFTGRITQGIIHLDLTGPGGPMAAIYDRVHMDKGDVDS